MKFIIRGQKLEITDAIKSYIEEKIGKLDKYFENPNNLTATVVARVRGKEQIVEVTIPFNKVVLRAEVSSKDLYSAVDLVEEKIERQIRKNKSKIKKQNKSNIPEIVVDFSAEDDEEDTNVVVKRKVIEMKPMSEEEAILQMNLIGHEFFVYEDSTTGSISVLYKRKDGNFGVIETK